MDKIIRAVLLEKQARVAVIDTTETLKKAVEKHGLSPLAAAALGRTLTAGAYLGSNLKSDDAKFSLSIGGKGPLGRIVVAGDSKGHLRGFVDNPSFYVPHRETDGKIDVRAGVGTEGEIIVVKDLGLKEPYIGRTELVSGEIAEDFAMYLYKSEGVRSIVALGVLCDKTGVLSSGGVIAEALPDASENVLVIIEDVMSNMTQVSSLIKEKGAQEIFDFYFSHLDSEILAEDEICWQCTCSRERVASFIKGMGKKEATSVVKESGAIEAKCEFCSSVYSFGEDDVEQIFSDKK